MEMILEYRRVGRTCMVKLSRWAMPEVCSSAFVRDGYLQASHRSLRHYSEGINRMLS